MTKFAPFAFVCLIVAALFATEPTLSAQTSVDSAPSIVRIELLDAGEPVPTSLGFIVEEDGFLLTAYQSLLVPENGELSQNIRVTYWDESKPQTYPASIVGVEPTINLGVLKIDADREFRESQVKKTKGLEIGEEVLAPRASMDPINRTTLGRLSGLNSKECYQESLTSTMIRAEIQIPDGAVGGPVYTRDGEVVAIYTAYKPTPQEGHVEDPDESHLLPVFLAFNIYESIKQKKSLSSPWTGFSVRPLTPEEQKLFPTAKRHTGAIGIEHIWPNSPAERMGVREGDLLVQFSHNHIRSVADFQKWLYMYGVGHAVKLVFLRDGKEYLVADYTIEERPAWANPR